MIRKATIPKTAMMLMINQITWLAFFRFEDKNINYIILDVCENFKRGEN